jgi:hypothetical protein
MRKPMMMKATMSKSLAQRIRQLSSLWLDDPHEDFRNEVAAALERAEAAEAKLAAADLQLKSVHEEYALCRKLLIERAGDAHQAEAKLAAVMEAVVEACATECKMRDEAKRIMDLNGAQRYAEAAHALANLKARVKAISTNIPKLLPGEG